MARSQPGSLSTVSSSFRGSERRAPLLLDKAELPDHIKDMLYGPSTERKLLDMTVPFKGLLTDHELLKILDTPLDRLSEDKILSGKEGKHARPQRAPTEKEISSITQSAIWRKHVDVILARNRYGKYAFQDLGGVEKDSTARWIEARLASVCQHIRYELPLDKRVLEKMSPLEYVAGYTRLSGELSRRYTNLFKKYKEPKPDKFIRSDKLYKALSHNFGGCLSEDNFDVVWSALILDDHETLLKDEFIGLAALTDRLFWTYYVQQHLDDDTMRVWAPNRTVLEVVDMDCLIRKLDGYKISKYMFALLNSLA